MQRHFIAQYQAVVAKNDYIKSKVETDLKTHFRMPDKWIYAVNLKKYHVRAAIFFKH